MPLDDPVVFAAVAVSQGLSEAARRLGVSKAMVSTAVSRLEGRLGVRLFQRATRRLSLTEAGIAALPHAQRALLAGRDTEEAATSLRTTPSGTLRVNAPMSFGVLHVAPALGEFARRYPDLHVDLVLDDRVLDLVDGGFDLAVRIGVLADSSLIASRIGTDRNVLVASPEYLGQHGAPSSPCGLADHPVLVYTLSSTGADWSLTRDNRTETVQVSGPVRANSSLALLALAREGPGIARMPRFVVDDDLAAGRLVQVLPVWSLPTLGIHVVATARGHQPAKTRAFVDFLRGRFREAGA